MHVSCHCAVAFVQTAIMAVADLYQSYGDALLPHTDVGGQAKPLTSLLAQVRAVQMLEGGRHAALACLCSRMSSSASAAPLRSCFV